MSQPIGIFDSGVGGLTVAAAIKAHLPNESFVYFGDTRHAPYGDKSGDTIKRYSEQITEFLIDQDCKAIVIACNTASALAFNSLQKKFSSVPIINVVDPVAQFVGQTSKGKVGVIATRATTQSGIYKKRLLAINDQLQIVTAATPLLVGVVEEGFMNTPVSHGAIKAYLDHSKFKDLELLILGCTHFPLLQPEIETYFEGKTTVVDSPELVALDLKNTLKSLKLLTKDQKKLGVYQFFVSEKTRAFSKIAKNFFGENISLVEKVL